MMDSKITSRLQSQLNSALGDGESIQWATMPKPIFFTKYASGLFLFGIPWNYFFVIFFTTSTRWKWPTFENENDYLAIGVLPFLLIGIGLLLSPILAYRHALKTVFAVTNRRVILLNKFFIPRDFSAKLGEVNEVYRCEHRDGTSDIILNQFVKREPDGLLVKIEYEIERIHDGVRVDKLINSLMGTSNPPLRICNKPKSEALPSALPEYVCSIIQREIRPEESILWSEMPKPVLFNDASNKILWFGIVWTLFSSVVALGFFGFEVPDFSSDSDYFALYGMAFVLIGFGLMSSPLWIYRSAMKTCYVITNHRAILFDAGWGVTIRSFHPEQFNNVIRRDHSDEAGDLIFVTQKHFDSDGDPITDEFGFFRIGNASQIEKLLHTLAKQTIVETDHTAVAQI